MEIAELIRACSDPAAYPYAVEEVEVHQTHISVVFLAGACAYKVKKAVLLDFLDYSTLEKRHHFCGEEVRLNRRLAPEVYLGVVPVVRTGDGLRLEGQGAAVEWAVKMRRLPDDARFDEQLRCGRADAAWVERVARRIAAFHRQAEAGPAVAAFGRFSVVARNARENLTQVAPQVGVALSRPAWERLRALTEERLATLRHAIEDRAARGVPRDTHGDLRLDHVYLFPERQPPHDLAVVDCIEFNERFRFADPVADMAFLAMDLAFRGWRALAGAFADAYFQASGDTDGRVLLPFYTAYRAAVRGKVEGIEFAEKEVPPAEREAAGARARAHWLLALGELEAPARRPCLVLVGGLPGAGKSTLADGLARDANFDVVRSDAVRKELAGLSAPDGARSPFGEGIYTPEWNERTYAACLRRAGELLFQGRRVLVDASFREERWRRAFLEAAVAWGVPGAFLLCRAEPEVVKGRLDARRGSVSDADWAVYREAARRWEEVGPPVRPSLREVSSGGDQGQTLQHALAVLRDLRLAE